MISSSSRKSSKKYGKIRSRVDLAGFYGEVQASTFSPDGTTEGLILSNDRSKISLVVDLNTTLNKVYSSGDAPVLGYLTLTVKSSNFSGGSIKVSLNPDNSVTSSRNIDWNNSVSGSWPRIQETNTDSFFIEKYKEGGVSVSDVIHKVPRAINDTQISIDITPIIFKAKSKNLSKINLILTLISDKQKTEFIEFYDTTIQKIYGNGLIQNKTELIFEDIPAKLIKTGDTFQLKPNSSSQSDVLSNLLKNSYSSNLNVDIAPFTFEKNTINPSIEMNYIKGNGIFGMCGDVEPLPNGIYDTTINSIRFKTNYSSVSVTEKLPVRGQMSILRLNYLNGTGPNSGVVLKRTLAVKSDNETTIYFPNNISVTEETINGSDGRKLMIEDATNCPRMTIFKVGKVAEVSTPYIISVTKSTTDPTEGGKASVTVSSSGTGYTLTYNWYYGSTFISSGTNNITVPSSSAGEMLFCYVKMYVDGVIVDQEIAEFGEIS